jgi:hypothetical protein
VLSNFILCFVQCSVSKFVNRPIFHRESCSILSVTKFSISILIFANLSPHLRRKSHFCLYHSVVIFIELLIADILK